ncbi:MAG: AI-2E family transporter [Methylococcaceae bacterium]|nr:AI-2E family transporter [Methylococcaceae bacterium]
MNLSKQKEDKILTNRVIEIVIRLTLIFLIITLCFQIIKPFIIIVLWGIIIAVAVFPLYKKLPLELSRRNNLAAIFYTLFALSLLIGPLLMVSGSLVETSSHLAQSFKAGNLVIPPPNKSVSEWPLVGEKIYDSWNQASSNIKVTLQQYFPEIKQVGEAIFSAIAGIGGSILQFIFSIIISGVFLANAQGSHATTVKIISRLTTKEQEPHFTELATATIRSVTLGVLGVAVIQATLGGIGMSIMNVPGWGLWTLIILVLAVAQLPVLIVLLPVIIYVFSVTATIPAVIFTLWSVLIGLSDNLLKPLLMGRGMETPTLVILLGAIGGMLLFGILGLFVGAIILALGYELFMAWLNRESDQEFNNNE